MNLEQIKKLENAKKARIEEEDYLKVRNDNSSKQLNEILGTRLKSEVSRLKAAASVHFDAFFENGEFEVEISDKTLIATYGEYTVKF